MTALSQDLLYAVRLLRRSPGFAAIAVLTLALGIGANTALFSVVNGVLLNPLPYPHSEQLVAVYANTPGFEHGPVVYLNFLDWQRDTQTFSSMALYRNQDYNVTGTAEAERLSGYMISAEFFSTLGVKPILGRTFRPDDDRLGAAPVVILGGGLWKRKFGSSPDVVGKALTLNGTSYMVVGVIPAEFHFLRPRSRRLHAHRPVERSFVSRSPHLGERACLRALETGRYPHAGQSRHGSWSRAIWQKPSPLPTNKSASISSP